MTSKNQNNRLQAWYESLLQFAAGVDLERLLARVVEDNEEQMRALPQWFPEDKG